MPSIETLRAGQLRHRIQIVQPTLAQDSTGGWTIDDPVVLIAEVPAKIEALSGRELYAAQQRVAEVTHKITIRWMPGLKANMNVWFGARQFQVQHIDNPDEVVHALYLYCVERDDSAREAGGGDAGAPGTPVTPGTPGIHRTRFTSTAGQTLFTLPGSPAGGEVDWYRNGLLQAPGGSNDYTLSDTDVTIVIPAKADDVFTAIYEL